LSVSPGPGPQLTSTASLGSVEDRLVCGAPSRLGLTNADIAFSLGERRNCV